MKLVALLAGLMVGLLNCRDAQALAKRGCFGRMQCPNCGAEARASYRPGISDRVPVVGRGVVVDRSRSVRQPYARVLSSNYQPISATMGHWQGRIQGNGHVYLRLIISRGGLVQSNRYMGHVELANKATTFQIRSAIPTEPGWSWKIVAGTTKS